VIPVGIALQCERIHFRETHAGDETMTARWVFGGKYVMTVGKPMDLDGDVNDRAAVHAATDWIMQHIVALTAQSATLLPAAATGRTLAASATA
jgi:hypothetical protein